ncbi:neprilysin-2-like [Drosophila kikkawai]|uniref:Neprilysin-2-like n=1 Tax=Drosophila kikkawai TaxID=30033 RepID=A0A6P4IMN7_DROKI|nr:neprilysin-4-like [Drosophila kikkawai]
MKRIVQICCQLLLLLGLAAGSRIPRAPNDTTANDWILDYVERHMDKSASPCEEFHRYATGKFKGEDEQDDIYSIPDTMILHFNERLQSVLDQLKDQAFTEANSVEEKVWRYYNTCLTAPESTRSPRHYLELVSSDENLTWPQFAHRRSKWPQEEFNWLQTLAQLRRYGMENSIIRMNVVPDAKDSTKFLVTVITPEVEKFLNVDIISDLLITIGVDRSQAQPLASKLVQLDTELYNFTAENKEEARLDEDDFTNAVYTLDELQNRTGLHLEKYLEIVFGRPINGSFEVEVLGTKYLEGLEEILQKYDSDVVASYLMVKFVHFLMALDGSEPDGDPGRCLDAVRFHMEQAGDLLYEDHYLKPEKLQKYTAEVQRIFEAIKQSFKDKLEKNHLHLSPAEVAALKEKLLAMTVTVGILPSKANHRRFVTDFYQGLELDSKPDFAKAQLEVLKLRTRRVLDQLNGAYSKDEGFFQLYDEISNNNPVPWFEVSGNTIILAIEMLREPVLATKGQHDVFKVSLLGYLLARKLMENFTPYFLPFDGKGNYGEVLRSFENYPSYVDALACLNATQTKNLAKRVIDVVSLGIAYDAYFGENSQFDQKQPDFTEVPLKQLFLLSVAQWFLGDAKYLDYGVADQDDVRLNQAIRNLPYFAEIFNCPTSAVLNPTDKCQVW